MQDAPKLDDGGKSESLVAADAKLFVTIARKPIGVAVHERLPIVQVSIRLSDVNEAYLANMLHEADRRLSNDAV